MNLRTIALAAAAGALAATGAASAAQAAPSAPHSPNATDAPDTARDDGVALVKKDALTPWSLVDFALEREERTGRAG
ncbi:MULTISPECIES: hypothetical protein [Streptomyces]|uniref:Uncharacterized protein n=2 Tax=Streptomyces TaxID=1883 RepID=A0A100Y9Y9_9ACTN|nr:MULTISPECIES: hypothetical protein [Streptomyces]KUH40314.1 hypothetical protein ATE80_03235 [Streptomyces kanasensis]UUS34310.1 hypothetical protein NRO40_28095 [Streptomyces changanensis]